MGYRIHVITDAETAQRPRTQFPVSVILERVPVTGNRWLSERWQAVGVVAGEHVSGAAVSCTPINTEGETPRYLWRGFQVELFKDEAESYYFNLLAQNPSIFVVCRQDEEGVVAPFLVTVSYDAAGAHMETDDIVFSVPMPPEIYLWVERYVLDHYVPEKKRKRKRQ